MPIYRQVALPDLPNLPVTPLKTQWPQPLKTLPLPNSYPPHLLCGSLPFELRCGHIRYLLLGLFVPVILLRHRPSEDLAPGLIVGRLVTAEEKFEAILASFDELEELCSNECTTISESL